MPNGSLDSSAEEYKDLAENQEKIAVVEKCIEENKRTRLILQLASHLLTRAREGYAVMDPWSKEHRTLVLKEGPVDVFADAFVMRQIAPVREKLKAECDEVIGFTGVISQNEGLLGLMAHTQSLRDRATAMGIETTERCDQFLQDRNELNKRFPIIAYFQVNSRLSQSLRDVNQLLGQVTGLWSTLNVLILEDRKFTLPTLRAQKQGFFSAPRPILKDQSISSAENQQTEGAISNPKTWSRIPFGKAITSP